VPKARPRKSVRKSAPAKSRTRRRPSRRKTAESLDQRVRRIVREELGPLEDRIDYLASEASLADGSPIPAENVWKKLGN